MGTLFFSEHFPPCLGLCFFQSWNFLTTLGQTSSCLLEPGFWILTKGVKRQPVRHQTYSPSFLDHVSRVTCHMSRVTFHVSRVTCHIFFFWQSGEGYRWRVCYQRGLPRLVIPSITCTGGTLCFFIVFGGITSCGSASLKLCICKAASPWSQSSFPDSQCGGADMP